MLEDGEISNSPKSAAPAADDDDDDGFVVDRSFLEVIENSEDVADDDAAANVTGDSEAVKDISMASSLSGTPSEWAKKMRKRLLEESEPQSPSTEPVSKRPRRQNLCFNCREEHSIADCPHPKNFAEIRKNKQEFQALQQGNTGGARISKETAGGAAKESKFKAGKISIALRDALGLGSDDLPEWIYRMRRMGFRKGYPPGYLRESLKHEYGTLKIFSGDSKEEEMEEQSCPMPIVQESKIVTYLGFNKSYGALNDREKGMFSIPPMKEFVEMLQEVQDAKSRHEWEESRRRCDLERLKRQEAAEKDSEDVADDSVIVVEEVKEESVVILETSEDTVVAREGTEKLGESIHQLIGTPIISRRDASGVWIPQTTPTLEAFAVGIVPFEAKEEEKPRGIFKKIMATLRGEESKSDDDK
ncbi:hypothetical protein L5515_000226 [Caenorhabditis briggsae]|uniref:PSP proline-rich domain-containing protein n=1 Tax=Caenorhabditis briggsae TaxID=6238 RepID=A0AAE9DZD0_CAEBR|nr:hypothetical protein L5515_000226 [Caenorhabditis briggsae]